MPTDTVSIEQLSRSFESGNTRFAVNAEIKPLSGRNVAPYLTVDLTQIDASAKALSMTADIYEKRGGRWVDVGGGQAYDELRKAFPNDPTVGRLCDIWQQYHMCDSKAGTREQNAVIDRWKAEGYPGGDHGRNRYDYADACTLLQNAGLLDVPIPEAVRANFAYKRDKDGNLPITYRYGSAWLADYLPESVAAELRELMKAPAVTTPEAENRSQLAKLGIRMSCEYADRNPNMPDARDMNHYKCTLSRRRQRMTVYFSMGYAHRGEPTINQVFDTLIQDALMVDNAGSFEEFCSELGYDPDSRKAERIWKASEHQASRLKTFLGEELYAELTAA